MKIAEIIDELKYCMSCVKLAWIAVENTDYYEEGEPVAVLLSELYTRIEKCVSVLERGKDE